MRLLKLLGVPRLVTEESVFDIPPKQVLLLATYLAYKEDWCSRDELLNLFWPDEPEKTARHNLSQLLYYAKGQRWIEGLETERNRVRWLVDTDVKAFHSALGDSHWEAAGKHYDGALLEGVRLETNPNFEDWLAQERESLQSAWRESVLNHASKLGENGLHAEAARQLRAVLTQDPLAEDILQAYMQAAVADGQRDQALKAYDAFYSQLEEALGMAPLEETRDLAQKISSSQQTVSAKTASPTPDRARLYRFPTFPTPFIGRDLERAELAGFWQEEERRLITLLGPGGIGKTRLAAQVAKEQAHRFADGVVFVSLAPLEHAHFIPRLLLEALSPQVAVNVDETDYLKQVLEDKDMLLVMDNLEHLPESALLISDLLDTLPALSVLATSREALDIRGESIYDLKGLLYPQAEDEPLEAYDAVTFFLRSARRAHPAFSVTEQNKGEVIKLCQLLNGMPLALELAATWVRLLSPGELVEELGKNLDTLESTYKDGSARHRSIRAVLEHSWQLLNDVEQDALSRLAVFQDGFTKDAAQHVAAANLRTLLSLINKSLLQRTQGGRFERLVVVRQFCLEKLSNQPDLLKTSRQAHAEHFVTLAEEARGKLDGEEKALWLDKLAQDHSNLRSAQRWLLESEQATLGLRLGNALFPFWWLRGHYREGRAFMTEALALSDEQSALGAKALATAGALARLCEDLITAKAFYEESLAIKRDLGDDAGIASTLGNLGMIHRLEGDYKRAQRLVEESVAIYEQVGDKARVANGVNNLAAIAVNLGDMALAWHLNEKSLKLANDIGERFIAARSLGNLGSLALAKGNLERAQALREESLRVFEELEYKVGIAVTHQGLGDIALARERYALAREKYLEALGYFEDLDDTRGIAEVLDSMTELMMAVGQVDRAMRFMGASSQLHQDLGISRQPDSLVSLETHQKSATTKLGAAEVARLVAEGARLSAEEAVLAMLEPVSICTDKVAKNH